MSLPPLSRTVILVLALLGCDAGPTGPRVPVSLQLERLEPLSSQHDEKLAIEVGAVAVDSVKLSSEEYVSVIVRSTSGGQLAARLTPAFCEDFTDPGRQYRCSQLRVRLHDDRSIEDLLPLLRQLDAQFLSVSIFSASGRVHVFSGSVPRALSAIRAHPAVKRASTVGVGFASPGGAQEPVSFLGAVLPTTNSEATPEVLRISNGDTITATYVQPNGSVLEVGGRVVQCISFLFYCS